MTLNKIPENEVIAIRAFYDAIEKLRESRIIRSTNFIGDIGEHIVTTACKLKLATSGRQKGWDATDAQGKKVQIKYFSAQVGKNAFFGDPTFYDYALVLLHPDSYLHPDNYLHPDKKNSGKFMLYKFPKEAILKFNCNSKDNETRKKEYSCGKKPFISGGIPLDL